jgi:hypothetical protein
MLAGAGCCCFSEAEAEGAGKVESGVAAEEPR